MVQKIGRNLPFHMYIIPYRRASVKYLPDISPDTPAVISGRGYQTPAKISGRHIQA